MSDEREQQVLDLLERVTDDRRDARCRLMNEDLFAFIPPDLRPGLETHDPEEWTYAVEFAEWLMASTNMQPLVASQLIVDFHERALEGLRRARERGGELPIE